MTKKKKETSKKAKTIVSAENQEKTKIQNSDYYSAIDRLFSDFNMDTAYGNLQNPLYRTSAKDAWNDYILAYKEFWEAKKIIDIPVNDALRNRPEISGLDPEVVSKLEKKLDAIKFWDRIKTACINERLLGGGIIYIGFNDYSLEQNNSDVLSTRVSYNEDLDIEYLTNISLTQVQLMNTVTNVLSPYYNNPSMYMINGNVINDSRLIVLKGDNDLSYIDAGFGNRTNNLVGFGPSKLESVWQDIIFARTSRSSAARLIQIASVAIALTDTLGGNQGTRGFERNMLDLKKVLNNITEEKSIIIDANKITEIKNLGANFGSIPELIQTYLKILSAASDVPATRFLGESPSGLNATGAGDLENYYNVIDSYQKNKLLPIVNRMYDYIGFYYYKNAWLEMRKSLKVEFPPLWNESQNEQIDRATKELANVSSAISLGIMSEQTAQKEVNARDIFLTDLTEADIVEDFNEQISFDEATRNLPQDIFSSPKITSDEKPEEKNE